jgi:hypothetical protein
MRYSRREALLASLPPAQRDALRRACLLHPASTDRELSRLAGCPVETVAAMRLRLVELGACQCEPPRVKPVPADPRQFALL